ncbi:MAG: sulfite reductase [Lysobacteraceae bacterium]|nr:MAG: sulfite reductase [Xanthomonadaceae bacterium]
MYQYDTYDQQVVDQRVAQFRLQTERYLNGDLSEEEFKPLRLMNGLYIQLHAPMLRIAIPYGLLSSRQMRALADITRRYDRSYGHFTTRQNLQINWPRLEDVPDILADLAKVQMHAIQTSGNCIRNVTTDHLSGIAADELEDPRPWAELIRQWSTLHPEFSFLPRKFKIAITGAERDRAAAKVHDIGLRLVRSASGKTGFEVLVGGGLGRTPIIGVVIRDFLPQQHLLSYLEAILRVYNRLGRRDNKYKARIKILVKAMGGREFAELVEQEWAAIRGSRLLLGEDEIEAMKAHFRPPELPPALSLSNDELGDAHQNSRFSAWLRHNTHPHKVTGYRAAYVSLKHPDVPPGDITAEQMDVVAKAADDYSHGLIRTTHSQNLLLGDVAEQDLYSLWQTLDSAGLASPNINTLSDIICCPGLDFCSLANARSIPIAKQINQLFDDMDYQYDLGELKLKMSGCMNACGHHHVGNIGILGVDKKGEEWYQITIGGSVEREASLGKVIGPAVPFDEVANTVERLLGVYIEQRLEDERFVDTVKRIGVKPFKEGVYVSALS